MTATAYLDHAASTPPSEAVLEAVARASRELFANPSSLHRAGAAAARALEEARSAVADALGAGPTEIVFTSGGTEANALAVAGAASRCRLRHAVVSAIEHPAVLRNVELLAQRGWELTVVAPGSDGVVPLDALVAALRPETGLVCLMAVNNELGTIQPCAELGKVLGQRKARVHFHVDAVQAFGHMSLRPSRLGADTVALSAHKIHGPKGAGALWIRPGSKLEALYQGGGHERGLRPGTENLPALVGFGVAAKEAAALGEELAQALAQLRDSFEQTTLAALPEARATVTGGPRAPHIVSLCLPSLPAEPLLHALESHGVLASAGSACASRARGQSHVLRALGVPEGDAVLRFSLGKDTTKAELAHATTALVASVAEIRGVAKAPRSR